MRETIDFKLSRAINGGRPWEVITLLNEGACVDARFPDGNTPLTLAAQTNHLEALDVLLHYQADCMMKNKEGKTVKDILTEQLVLTHKDLRHLIQERLTRIEKLLSSPQTDPVIPLWSLETQDRLGHDLIEASKEGDLEQVQRLISKGANVLHQNKYQQCPMTIAQFFGHEEVTSYLTDVVNKSQMLITAIYNGDNDRAFRLLDKGTHPICYDRYGHLGILVAAERGNFELVRHMISRGVDVNVYDAKGNNLMQYAVRLGSSKMVDYLLDKGYKGFQSVTPSFDCLEYAMKMNDMYLIQRFVSKKVDAEFYMPKALDLGAEQSMRYFLSLGADLKRLDSQAHPALIRGIRTNNPHIVELLLKAKVMVDQTDNYQQWPLLEAVKSQNPEIVHLLLKHHATVDKENSNGWTALMEACKYPSGQIAKLLIEAGADVNKQDIYGWTPLMVAARHNSQPTAGECYVAKADLDKKNNEGKTALMIAMENNNPLFARYMLFCGADNSTKGARGEDLIFWAVGTRDAALVDFMIVSGQNPNATEPLANTTPLSIAVKQHNLPLVELLLQKGANPLLADKYGHTPLSDAKNQLEYTLTHGLDENIKNIYYLIKAKVDEMGVQPCVIQKAKPLVDLKSRTQENQKL
ncbi:MAG: ankyrin repeat domain-containing protein [Alphaproteobacteria bacterium]|nr:ankyrin repeat domain-containing protein [Alphaproteobacteria bacterium]